MNNVVCFEDRQEFESIILQYSGGITQQSLKDFDLDRKSMGKIQAIYLLNSDADGADYLTYIVNENNVAWKYDGFSWGYSGEGPRGLVIVFKKLGWTRPKGMPPANVTGCWKITALGTKIERVPIPV